ncbi:hypothetical protein UNSWDHB_2781 [Dehalobacter sp. UNSWDHB]|jgi:hypothetical protein|uniref:hypothetical protein n=1 Tax=unclassified Dehalobacter TaxID=2635733 RepID=UPI00028A82FB|nr:MULTISPECIES: hypothetical protein [unclassified Dehalobacter]AFV03925.1 hypothetical protein DHBDCA_p2898 [Dehalobacter sp. DCA]AFV06904.1 hypothetical protein DCF50_p2901 [Dehalobacter sp. CF]EQB19947.1 hypothetical protein UNSWDHB_2781 [Dehalobacter sp. UNSWDHB]
MIIQAVSTIGMLCSHCGKLQLKTLSVFSFVHLGKNSFICTCGTPLLTLISFESKKIGIEYSCIYCGTPHHLVTRRELIWGEQPLRLGCSDKELPVGYIGPESRVMELCTEIKKNFVRLASELTSDQEDLDVMTDDFFVVYGVIEILGRLVERKKLGCKCGNHNLTVEILPESVELICDLCKAMGIIYTDNKDILRILEQMGAITLEENEMRIINDSLKGNHRKNIITEVE